MKKTYIQNISYKKISKIFIFILSFIVVGCSSEKSNESLSKIQNEYKAETVQYSSGVSANTSAGSQKYIKITIVNPQTLIDSTYTSEDIASKSSLTILNSLSDDEKNSINYIQIIIESSQNSFSSEYTINKLIKINEVINKTIIKVADDFIKQDYNDLVRFFEDDIPKKDLILNLQKTDDIYGKGNKYTFIGFSFINTITDKNNNKIPMAKFRILLNRPKLNNTIDFYLDYESITNKIEGINM